MQQVRYDYGHDQTAFSVGPRGLSSEKIFNLR